MESTQLVPDLVFRIGQSASGQIIGDLENDVGITLGLEICHVNLDGICCQFSIRQPEKTACPKSGKDVPPSNDIVTRIVVYAPRRAGTDILQCSCVHLQFTQYSARGRPYGGLS